MQACPLARLKFPEEWTIFKAINTPCKQTTGFIPTLAIIKKRKKRKLNQPLVSTCWFSSREIYTRMKRQRPSASNADASFRALWVSKKCAFHMSAEMFPPSSWSHMKWTFDEIRLQQSVKIDDGNIYRAVKKYPHFFIKSFFFTVLF